VNPWSSLHWGFSAVDMVEKLYQEIIPKYFGKDVEIQVLSPMSKGSLGTHNLNEMIQKAVNPEQADKAQLDFGGRTFRVNDRVIQRKNNYDLNVFNGDIGRILEIDNEEMSCSVLFGSGSDEKEVIYEKAHLTELDHAYAITIHKSQGSEFAVVIIPLLTQHYNMLFRNLIYTGLTRAKKVAVFVGSRRALRRAVSQRNSSQRQTALQWLIKEGESDSLF
jgi:exodeoxyribonuclease V alpha subunit